jgi:hypothetical protein
MRRTWIIIGLAVAMGVALAAIYYSKPGHAPVGQASLEVMDSQALSRLQAEFNRMESSVRVILLLSPT